MSFGAARLGAWQRSEHLQRLSRESFDTIVVGGGVTGLGAALDAVTRGLSVAVLESGDLAQGTSSRSGKTLHGGYREWVDAEVLAEQAGEPPSPMEH